MATVKQNTAEGQTSGTTVSAANSGAGSGDAFSTVSIGTNAAITFDNAHAHGGTRAYKVSTTTTPGDYLVEYRGLTAQATYWVRAYYYFTANPTNTTGLYLYYGVSSATIRGYLQLNTAGKLQNVDAAFSVINTATNAISLNQWIRIEHMFTGSATVGQLEVKLFNTVESTTATETLTTTALQNTGGTVDAVWFGDSGNASVGPYWMDDIVVDGAAYPGPVAGAATGIPNVVMAPPISY